MELSEIEKKLAEFKAASIKKPPLAAKIEPAEIYTPAPPFEPVPQQPEVVPMGGAPCFSKCFKSLVENLKPGYFGQDTHAIVLDLVNQFPECGVAA